MLSSISGRLCKCGGFLAVLAAATACGPQGTVTHIAQPTPPAPPSAHSPSPDAAVTFDAAAIPDIAAGPSDSSRAPDTALALDAPAAPDTAPAIDSKPMPPPAPTADAGSPTPPPGLDAAAPSAPRPGSPRIAGCPAFPTDNEWNRPIANDPVDPSSTTYIAAMNGGTSFLHPEFGGNGAQGIPWISVPGSQPRVTMQFEWVRESDPGPYPFPMDAPIEGGPASSGDRHVLVLDRDNCKLYETYSAWPGNNAWTASSGAVFDLRSNALRPRGWTSADGAGLPVLPGLVRRDEVLGGRIAHALRFKVARTQKAHVHPATHHASNLTDPNLPPFGLRVRLKADYDLGRFTPAVRVILTALKEYGMFLADNGGDWFISGEVNPGWNDEELRQLNTVPASAFEVVKHAPIQR